MYGENEVNAFHHVKYGLLYEFYQYFENITIYGLPLTHCLTTRFLVHIQPYVDLKMKNAEFVKRIQDSKQFKSMGHINEILMAMHHIKPVSIRKSEKSILLSNDYCKFAIDKLSHYNISLYSVLQRDSSLNLPNHFAYYSFKEEMTKVTSSKVSAEILLLKKQIEKHVKSSQAHYYFSTPLFKKWFNSVITGTIKWVYMLEQLVLKTRPSIIVDPAEASLFGTILSLLAKKYRIPYVNMPILLIGDRTIIPSRSDYYFVWGENQKKWMLNRNIKDQQIVETGNIKFFYEKKVRNMPREEFINVFQVPENHIVAGFTTQPFTQTNHIIEKWILEIDEKLPVTFILKKHRNDTYDYRLLKKKKNVRFTESDIPLYDYLSHLDVLMTISSNTAIEAAIIHVPLFVLQPEIPYHYHLNHNTINEHLAAAGAGEIIRSSAKLGESLVNLHEDAGYSKHLTQSGKDFLGKTLFTIDQAPEIAAQKIESIIKSYSG